MGALEHNVLLGGAELLLRSCVMWHVLVFGFPYVGDLLLAWLEAEVAAGIGTRCDVPRCLLRFELCAVRRRSG